MGNCKTVKIAGVRYRIGEQLYYVNSYNQQFYAEIVGCWNGETDGKPCLFVKRRDWPRPELWHPDDYIRVRHWTLKELRELRPEHTCAGMYDMSCEACSLEETNLPGPEDRIAAPDTFDEPPEWDVIGGL